ncbi:adenylate/guanylate cyclase domain-containing protein [Rhizobium mongolense]|uniref:TolB-like protein/class 3 adenylate cyclase/Tfp pilus assembly protein PilF n=2 Tax=Rhizobium mongolense TaxID=57676 RepID=A0ABR6IMK5_9HYPH|nr:tetratricopeptide repeat protein [Rhizobium mongolense]MBB4229112.1 TolB-like protein/class 3 adenylate cyclase/Tfp pilus assembly protein PilF [Rhizobium mongolense]TVZ63334.1 TolB-like protein [Rhizobium mongolense USDA 1844]
MERRLTAILSADVVGYSRLMGEDEDGTLERLKACRRELVDPAVEVFHGRIIKLMGDGTLVEFASVVDAVRCAAVIQRKMAGRDQGVSETQRIQFRIGVNLGDVIVEGDDIYGDGVNIAARLQSIAPPGGICISGTAFDHAVHKADVGFSALGEQHLKNIADPVRVYRVLLAPSEAGTVAAAARQPGRRTMILAAVAALLIALTAIVFAWQWPFAPQRPSIAVLPFGDISNDGRQDYFAEGLTNDLITDLSKISGLLVIARDSAFSFKNKSMNVRQIAEQLNVRYVLEGSVRRAGDAVRINAQLVDAKTGRNIWAERYDRDYTDIFALQDEVIEHIVGALAVRLTDRERTQIARLPTRNLEAYDSYTRAEQKVYSIDYKSLEEALSLYEKAIKLDPEFADAHTGYARAIVDVLGFDYQPLMLSAVARQRAYEAAGRGLELNPQSSRAYAVLGILQMLDGEIDGAIASVNKAVALDPNGAESELNLAIVLTYAGQNPEALAAMERVLQLDPKPRVQVYDYYGLVLYMNHRYEEAIRALQTVRPEEPSDLGLETLAMANARLGRMAEAHKAVEAILEKSPGQSLASLRVVYSHHRRQQDLDHRLDALRSAKLPEWSYDFRGRPEDRLDAHSIRALAIDKTWIGHQHDGVRFFMELGANGDFALRAHNSIIVGKFSLENNFLCTRSSSTLLGRKFCSPVYRNPGGSAEKHDEYVLPDSANVWYFSVLP